MTEHNERMAALAKERRQKALALHESGLKLTEVGLALGIGSRQRVHQLVKQARAERQQAAG